MIVEFTKRHVVHKKHKMFRRVLGCEAQEALEAKERRQGINPHELSTRNTNEQVYHKKTGANWYHGRSLYTLAPRSVTARYK